MNKAFINILDKIDLKREKTTADLRKENYKRDYEMKELIAKEILRQSGI